MSAGARMTARGERAGGTAADGARGVGARPVAVVTGASRGIGRAIARRLAARYAVVAVARSAPDLVSLCDEIIAAGGDCRAVPLDVRDADAVAAALADTEADALVLNAGVGVLRPLLELSVADWRAMVGVNLDALFYVTRALLPGMLARGRGDIVTIGSLAGRSAFVGGTGYAATKHAVVGFTESLMLEVRDAGVRVAMVMPGSVATAFSARADPGWMLAAEDVAEAVWYVVTQPAHALVSRVEVRPARPGHG